MKPIRWTWIACVFSLAWLGCGDTADKSSPAIPFLDAQKADAPGGVALIGPIYFDGSVDGELNSDRQFDGYAFWARAGALITLDNSNAGTARDLDSRLYLFGPAAPGSGDYAPRPLVSDDDSGWGRHARIRAFEAPSDGAYLAVLGSYDGRGRGAYRLKLECENQECLPDLGADLPVQIIQDEQQPSRPQVGDAVQIQGVVVSSPPTWRGFYVTEPHGGAFAGIFVDTRDLEEPVEVEIGQRIDLAGTYEEHYDNSQIKASQLTPGEWIGAPTPSLVRPEQICTRCEQAERYEGVLVRVQGIEVLQADIGYGDFTVRSVGGPEELIVSDSYHQIDRQEQEGFDRLAGILEYSWNEFRLAPRDDRDVIRQGDLPKPPDDLPIQALRNPTHPDHPGLSAVVQVKNVVVISPNTGWGFWVAEPDGGPNSGLFVSPTDVDFGDPGPPGTRVDLKGSLQMHMGRLQLLTDQVNRKESGPAVKPMIVDWELLGDPLLSLDLAGSLVQIRDVRVSEVDTQRGTFWLEKEDQPNRLEVAPVFHLVNPSEDQPLAAITGVLDESGFVLRLLPRDAGDLADPGSPGEEERDDLTIQAIQDPTHLLHPGEGAEVRVRQVVVLAPSTSNGFWAGEPGGGPHSGVLVFTGDMQEQPRAKVGNLVDVVGVCEEHYGNTQIRATAVTITGQVAPPLPSLVSTAQVCTQCSSSEPYEGGLIRLENVTVRASEVLDDHFAVFQEESGSELMLDRRYISPALRAAQELKSVTGVVHYSWEAYRVVPRGCADLMVTEALTICDEITEPAQAVSIAQIRDPNHAYHIPNGSEVHIEGVVTSPVFQDGWVQAFAVQSQDGGPYSGILIHAREQPSGIEPGNLVGIRGETANAHGMSVIELHEISVLGSSALPEPATVRAADINATGFLSEAYESMLLQVSEAITTSASIHNPDDGAFQIIWAYNAAERLPVGDVMKTGFACPPDQVDRCGTDERATFQQFETITGILYEDYGSYSLEPRWQADFNLGGSMSPDRMALQDELSSQHQPRGYEAARDFVLRTLDNTNGAVRCVYTDTWLNIPAYIDFNLVNIEHTWPKSLGAGSWPAKADVHHLFSADNPANSARSSYHFGETTGDRLQWSRGGSRLGWDAEGRKVFEPRDAHKGDAARALFYFSVRYGISIVDSEEAILRRWHEQDPPDDRERARNEAIQAFQGNRNPFVDSPDQVDLIDDY